MQPAAASAITAMNQDYRAVFGHNICITEGYRTLAKQISVKATKGYLAATPGTSMHGWGLAVDLCSSSLAGRIRQVDPRQGTAVRMGEPAVGQEF